MSNKQLSMLLSLTFISFFVHANIQAQKKVSDKQVDLMKVAQCQSVVDDVDGMELNCDTIHYRHSPPCYELTSVSFDKTGRLRKYIKKLIISDGSHDLVDLVSYYNSQGSLVFLSCITGSNCEDDEAYYYLDNGRILDYKYAWHCGCCEEEATEEEMGIIRPKINDLLDLSCDGITSYKQLISADTLLNILLNEKYEYFCAPELN